MKNNSKNENDETSKAKIKNQITKNDSFYPIKK
jgi:hypothetical protein